MIDTHCHLNDPVFTADVSGVVERARLAGVTKIVVPGVNAESSIVSVKLAEQFAGQVFAAIGIQPSEAETSAPLLSELPAVAIGEVGLDYYRPEENPTKEIQEKVFREMITLAKTRRLPLIVHSRDAFDDTKGILKEMAPEFGVVIHCFTGTSAEAAQWLDMSYHISVTGIITFKNSGTLRDMVSGLPLERLMTETDAPSLAPEGFRGQTCEPWHVSKVSECLDQIFGKPTAEITTRTAEQFFHI